MSDVESKAVPTKRGKVSAKAPAFKVRRLSPASLKEAVCTVGRVQDLLAHSLAKFPLLEYMTYPDGVGEDNISPAYKAALNGELAVLRASLYATGMFTTIECITL